MNIGSRRLTVRRAIVPARLYPMQLLDPLSMKVFGEMAESAAQGTVAKSTAEAALHEMLFSGGTLNTRLLGGEAVSNEALSRST